MARLHRKTHKCKKLQKKKNLFRELIFIKTSKFIKTAQQYSRQEITQCNNWCNVWQQEWRVRSETTAMDPWHNNTKSREWRVFWDNSDGQTKQHQSEEGFLIIRETHNYGPMAQHIRQNWPKPFFVYRPTKFQRIFSKQTQTASSLLLTCPGVMTCRYGCYDLMLWLILSNWFEQIETKKQINMLCTL